MDDICIRVISYKSKHIAIWLIKGDKGFFVKWYQDSPENTFSYTHINNYILDMKEFLGCDVEYYIEQVIITRTCTLEMEV